MPQNEQAIKIRFSPVLVKNILMICFMIWGKTLLGGEIDSSWHNQAYTEAINLMDAERNWKKAIGVAQSALERLKDKTNKALISKWQNVLGDCHLEMGNFNQAFLFYEQSYQSIENEIQKEQLAETLNKLGNYYLEVKQFEKAQEYLEQAIEVRKQIYKPRHPKLAQTYNNLGRCINELGDIDKAIEFHDLALAIRLEQAPLSYSEIAQSYNNRGLCWGNKGKYQIAIADYERAVEYYNQNYEVVHVVIGDVYFNLGDAYDQIGQFERALNYYREALKVYRRKLPTNHPSLALCYNNLGNLYARLSTYDQRAIEFHQQALRIRVQKFGDIHPDVAETYYNIGAGYYIKGDLQQAIENFNSCFHSLNYTPKSDAAFDNVNNFKVLIAALRIMANFYTWQFGNSKDPEHLEAALNFYLQLDKLIDFLRTRYETLGSKLLLATEAHQLYDGAIQVTQLLYQLKEDESYLRQAFTFSEKSKGFLLLQALKRSEAEQFSKIDEQQLETVKAVEVRLAELEKRRHLEAGNPRSFENGIIDSLDNLLFDHKRDLAAAISQLKRAFPEYYDLRYETAALSIEQIQEGLLRPNQSLVEYFLGNRNLYIFIINENSFHFVDKPLPSEFMLWVYTFQDAIRNFAYTPSRKLIQNVQLYQNAAHGLYQVLIDPIQPYLEKEITIIPGSELELIPFEALLSHSAEDLGYEFDAYPYLIHDYTINYNYSANLLHEMQSQRNKNNVKPYLGLAPKFRKDSTISLSELKFNTQEITGVSNIIGGRFLLKENASKSNFLGQQSNYKILHLATHGMADNMHGDYSFLAFSPDEAYSIYESLLYVKEIYNISTNAEMIVLSACETGTGAIQKGEGMASIARSFSYAGAKSLIASKWSVDDEATSQLMQFFFQNIKDGLTKDRALREAKLTFIEQVGGRNAHPYYWASFVPIGEMKAIKLKNFYWQLLWSIPVVITIYLVYFWFKVKKMERQLFSNGEKINWLF